MEAARDNEESHVSKQEHSKRDGGEEAHTNTTENQSPLPPPYLER